MIVNHWQDPSLPDDSAYTIVMSFLGRPLQSAMETDFTEADFLACFDYVDPIPV